MKKLLVVLAFGLLWAGSSEAAGPTRGAKATVPLNFSVAVTSVTVGPGVLYSIIMSSGAAQDFAVVFDSATGTGLTPTTLGATYRTRCLASSTTNGSQCNFDPPLQFNNGIMAVLSSAADQALIVFEKGRVTQGY